jgi:hypothetical protein
MKCAKWFGLAVVVLGLALAGQASSLALVGQASSLALVGQASSLQWVFYSQNDPAWACNQLGTCKDTTIGKCGKKKPFGCAVTAAAMLLKATGANADPAALNSWLTQHNGYSGGCNIKWFKLTEFPGGNLRWERNGSLTTPKALKSLLDQGRLMIARSRRFQQHWVVIRGYYGKGERWSDFWYWDPWDTVAIERRLGDGWVFGGATIIIFKLKYSAG